MTNLKSGRPAVGRLLTGRTARRGEGTSVKRDQANSDQAVGDRGAGQGGGRAVLPVVRRRFPRVLISRSSRIRLAVFAVATLLLTPILAFNFIGTANQDTFDHWDVFSESLVLSKIESTTPGSTAPSDSFAGLLIAAPDFDSPYKTFDQLSTGAQSATKRYGSYFSQLGTQGFFFTGLYHAGCQTVQCLEVVSAGMTTAALVGFAILLGLIAPRSLSVVVVMVALASPWTIASARNLYWVPWSWYLPALAAICFVIAPTRRRRLLAAGALLLLFSLRFTMGFEYLTSITLLAAGMPLVAAAFGHTRYRRWRTALRDVAMVFGVAVVSFVVVLLITASTISQGNLASGIGYILGRATVRISGDASINVAEAVAARTSAPQVVLNYFVNWSTDVLDVGWGAPVNVGFGRYTLVVLVLACAGVVLLRLVGSDGRWLRDTVLVAVALVIPISWFFLAKSHSFIHSGFNFVLWYVLCIAVLCWVPGAYAVDRLRLLPRRVRELALMDEPRLRPHVRIVTEE